MKITEGFTYDDVLLVPQRSFINHRANVNLETQISRNLKINIPLISANMDSVTESKMALAMAREGGIGIIHRFMTIDEEVNEVKKVKRDVEFIVQNPYTVTPEFTLSRVWQLGKDTGITGFMVIDENKRLVGILSHRDYSFESNPNKKVVQMMKPFSELIVAGSNTTQEKARKIFKLHKIEKLPIINEKRELLGLITARSIISNQKYPYSAKDNNGRYVVGASIGVVNDYLERAEKLVDAGVDLLVIDVAHGHNDVAIKALKNVRKKFSDIDIMGGNIATAEAAKDLIEAGADSVKIGIGPGGLCTTRVVAGVGFPQFSAVMNCAKEAKKYGVPVVADGGTNYPGDITKALAAGASGCMLAGWFAGTDESPGGFIIRKGMKFKIHRGSASFMSTADRKLKLEKESEYRLNTIVPEGVEALVPYKGNVSDVIYQLLGALRSGMSYCNAKTITELQKNAEFVKITDAGMRESKSHNVEEI